MTDPKLRDPAANYAHYAQNPGYIRDDSRLNEERNLEAARLIAERRPHRLLDVGCADGFFAELLPPYIRYEGIELNPAAAAGAYPAARGRVRVGNVCTDPLLAKRYDAIYCGETLEHVPDPEALLRHLLAAAVPGALLVSTSAEGPGEAHEPGNAEHLREWTAAEFRALHERAGWTVESVRLAEVYRGRMANLCCAWKGEVPPRFRVRDPKGHMLLVAPDDGASSHYIRRGFEDLGWAVDPFDHRSAAKLRGPERAARDLRLAARGMDLCLVLKGDGIAHSTLDSLEATGVKTAVWNFDVRLEGEPWAESLARSAGLWLTPSEDAAENRRKRGTASAWMPEAADPEIHRPTLRGPGDPVYPVSFVGTVDGVPGRTEWVRALAQGLRDDFHLFGSFPAQGVDGVQYHGRAEDHLDLPYDVAHNLVVGRSFVTLDRQRNPEQRHTYGARIFRVLAAGGFLLTNRISGIEDHFDGCLATYADDAQCAGEAKDWFLRDGYRSHVAKRGREEVLKAHTFRHRAGAILREVGIG